MSQSVIVQPDISEKLKLNEEEYIELDNLRIFCGTFNLNGKLCDESLASWLCTSSSLNNLESQKSHVDIYAIGFQELVDLTTTNLLISSNSIDKEIAWINAINNQLLNEQNFKVKYIF